MAEIAVNLVVDKLIPLLRDQVTVLRGVHDEVKFIKDHLQLMQAYLKDADMKAEKAKTSNVEKEWVKQLREVACRIEDVIDEYLLKVAKRRQKHGLPGLVSKIAGLLRSIYPRHEISSQIGDIRKEIDELNPKKEIYGFNQSGQQESSSSSSDATLSAEAGDGLRLGAHFLDDDQLVGIDRTKKQLTDWLLKGDRRRSVMAVVGEGGLGKTTVVKNLYKKQKEKKAFDCYAWITVAHSLKGDMLLRNMLKIFNEGKYIRNGVETMNKVSLTEALKTYLKGKRYMIVFDDVWEESFWQWVEFALPSENTNNRIIITTRDQRVAEYCRPYVPLNVLEMQPLSPTDSLRLFYQKAFQFDREGHPKKLRTLSKEIVKKCHGVPLAIDAIASLLATKKKNLYEWQKVRDSLGSKLASEAQLEPLNQVLSESYHDLPYHLKACLLYFGLFPENYSISCVRLIRLWVAEGFVKEKQNENEILEEIAEEYLVELIHRSLVKVSEFNFNGKVRSCKVHDLMHEFILKKCDELNFCQVTKDENFSFNSTARRLSIDTNTEKLQDVAASLESAPLRSCFIFNYEELSKPLMNSLLSKFKLLTGLDFEGVPIDHLPKEVGNLLHLKYLSLRKTNIKALPKSIGKLENLQTLDLKHAKVRELPAKIKRLSKLRHLLAYSYTTKIDSALFIWEGVKIKKGIGHLKNLQKLSTVDTSDGNDIIKELKELKQLRKLGVTNLRTQNGKAFCNAIESMTHLRSLIIGAMGNHEILDLQSLTHPPHQLQSLELRGRLERLPNWISSLQNLVRLCLFNSGLKEDPLLAVRDLPELLQLTLNNACEGDELHFGDGWFRKLKILWLQEMQGLKTIKIEKGALPLLETLEIYKLPQMVEVPADIQNLETLKKLYFVEVSNEAIHSMLPRQGKHYGMVKNIPFLYFSSSEKQRFCSLHTAFKINLDDETYNRNIAYYL